MTIFKRTLAAMLALAALAALGSCVRREDGGAGRDTSAVPKPASTQAATTAAPEPQDVRLTFACAGDNIVHESLYVQAAAEAASARTTSTGCTTTRSAS